MMGNKVYRLTESDLRLMVEGAVISIYESFGVRVYYRGTVSGSVKRISTGNSFWDNNLFVSKDRSSALCYGDSITTYVAKSGVRITTERAMRLSQRGGECYLDYLCRCLRKAMVLGYDIIEFDRQGDVGTIVINPDAVEVVD